MEAQDSNGRLRRWMIAAVGCALPPASALYLSTPITTGPRFVAWRRGPGARLVSGTDEYRRAHDEAVVAPNRAAATTLVRELRARLDRPVIDPTALEDVPDWRQFDYHRLWLDIIGRFAAGVIAADGWQYSSGCVLEVATAARLDLPLTRPDGTPLASAAALRLVREAIADVRADGVLPGAPLEEARAALERGIVAPTAATRGTTAP